MKDSQKITLFIVFTLFVVIVAFASFYFSNKQSSSIFSNFLSTTPAKYDTFASCLSEKGAKFYGAFWCPHCQKQKSLFGSAVKKVPYIECSTPNGKDALPVCTEAKITSYPTWKFIDGTIAVGEQSLETLSKKTSCPLPLN